MNIFVYTFYYFEHALNGRPKILQSFKVALNNKYTVNLDFTSTSHQLLVMFL